MVIGDERLTLDPEHLVRVDAGIGRVLASGPEGLRVLCIGAAPGIVTIAIEIALLARSFSFSGLPMPRHYAW